MNAGILTGNIGNEIELKTTPTGKTVCNFSLAVRESKDQTMWVDVVAWNKTAEILSSYAHKGSKIAVQGKLSIRPYKDKEGNQRRATEIIASSVELLDSKGSKSQNADVGYSNGTGDFAVIDNTEDLPFL